MNKIQRIIRHSRLEGVDVDKVKQDYITKHPFTKALRRKKETK